MFIHSLKHKEETKMKKPLLIVLLKITFLLPSLVILFSDKIASSYEKKLIEGRASPSAGEFVDAFLNPLNGVTGVGNLTLIEDNYGNYNSYIEPSGFNSCTFTNNLLNAVKVFEWTENVHAWSAPVNCSVNINGFGTVQRFNKWDESTVQACKSMKAHFMYIELSSLNPVIVICGEFKRK